MKLAYVPTVLPSVAGDYRSRCIIPFEKAWRSEGGACRPNFTLETDMNKRPELGSCPDALSTCFWVCPRQCGRGISRPNSVVASLNPNDRFEDNLPFDEGYPPRVGVDRGFLVE